MSGRSSAGRADAGSASLVERLAPPPPVELLASTIERHTQPGDVVLDLHGRGGWVARAALRLGRRPISLEQGPLTRLLAELVLRPPDVHHLDAALDGLAATPAGDVGLEAAVTAPFASTCPSCGAPVIADGFTWAIGADTGDRKADGVAALLARQIRCAVCRDAVDAEPRSEPATDEDRARASAAPAGHEELRASIRARFPVPRGSEALVEDVLGIHTTRQLAGLARILAAIEGDLRAEPIEAALRLALLEAVLPASRLATPGGRPGPLRIRDGRVRIPRVAVWVERNPWAAFRDGFATVRRLVEALAAEGTPRAAILDALPGPAAGPGAAPVAVLGLATATGLRAFAAHAAEVAGRDPAARVSLAIGQPPRRPDAAHLAVAWHGTAWALGRDAAAALAVEPLLGPAFTAPWDWQAAALRRTLRAVAPLVDADTRAVLLVEGVSPEPVVAVALAAAAAGFRLAAADTAPPPGMRLLELVAPGGSPPPGPRTRANVALPPVAGAAGDPELVSAPGLFSPPERIDARPFSAIDAAGRVSDAVVATLSRRGEPAPFATLLGEILVSLDRAGQLRRLAAARPPEADDDPDNEEAPDADDAPDAVFDAGGGRASRAEPAPDAHEAAPAVAGRAPVMAAAPGDHVGRLLSVIRDELSRPTQRRLVEVERDVWWLRDPDDRAAAAQSVADRLEWATYSLLATGVPISERRFHERIDALFRGADRPEPELVAATLESYRSPAIEPGMLVTDEDLVRRSHEHTELIAALSGAGRRLGMGVWIAPREHGRRVGGETLAERLTDLERDVYLPRITRGPVDALEEVDVIWYVRDRATFLVEVEWTAMIGDLLRRHVRIPHHERLVRLLVVPPERSELVRHKIERSAPLRDAFEAGNWHVLKWNHLATFLSRDPLELGALEPLLGFDPAVEQTGEQLPLFRPGR